MRTYNEDLISVIVPAYNVGSYIERCLKSICAQTYNNLEIIVVDDGSTDNTYDVAKIIAEQDERIILISQSNKGTTAARNKAINSAHGKYVGFVDGDDWIEPDMYEVLYEGCIQNNAEICVGRFFLDKGESSNVAVERSFSKGIITKQSGVMPHHIIYSDDFLLKGLTPNLCDKLFLTDFIKEFQKNVDERTVFAEDDLCVYAALLGAESVVVLDKPIYHYCIRDDSLTQKTDEQYFEKISFFYKQMKKVFDSHIESDLLNNKLDRYMAELIIRGLNRSFEYGRIVAFFQPPYQKLIGRGVRNVIIYGAGDVGQDYNYELRRLGYNVIAWCDKRWEELRKQGMSIEPPEKISDYAFDAVIIAVESNGLSERIKKYLIDDLGIAEDKVVSEEPKKIISNNY
jgi:glycosyltransferase involved in cell wall biosynthesis